MSTKINFVYTTKEAKVLDYVLVDKKGILQRLILFYIRWYTPFLLTNYQIQRLFDFFFVSSKNQYDALSPLIQHYKNSMVYSSELLPDEYRYQVYPRIATYLIALFFSPRVIYCSIKAKGYEKKSYKYFFTKYLLTYGYFFTAYTLLDKIKPAVLIMSNDHSMENRSLLEAVKNKSICTLYMQHASIYHQSYKLPALEFSYALLDGLDALKKYESFGPTSTTVFLIGVVKFDAYMKNINKESSINRIGICRKHD